MCVIVVQNKGVFPGWDTLHNCWDRNPHGAGFMYQDDDKVVITKGLMTFQDFEVALKKVPNYEKRNLVYHFRIATHGSTLPSNTHPFPVTKNVEYLKSIDIKCPVAIAHNGMISRAMFDELERKTYNLTDTAQFIRDLTTLCLSDNGETYSKKLIQQTLKLESIYSGSRFAMMDAKNIYLYGTFYEHEGCMYSNTHSYMKYDDFGDYWDNWKDFDKWKEKFYAKKTKR